VLICVSRLFLSFGDQFDNFAIITLQFLNISDQLVEIYHLALRD